MSNRETLPANRSALPSQWIDRLFSRFSSMYGAAWLEKWRGVDPADVRRTWAEDLAGFDGETLRRALDPAKASCQFPPSCPEFVAICRQFRSPPARVAYLAAPTSAMPQHIAEQLHQFVHGERKDCRGWAKKILANPSAYPHISRTFAEDAMGIAHA